MSEVYKVGLRVKVTKGTTEEVVVEEEFYFSDLSFSKMTHNSNEFYELITKLQK